MKAQIVHGFFFPFKSALLLTVLYCWPDYRPGDSLGVFFHAVLLYCSLLVELLIW